jgi:F-type H+-transporting ATPase subunit b
MEIIQKFGLETKLFLFQLVNFLIIVFVLKKFLFTPLKKILDERRDRIEHSLQDAKNIKITLENADIEKKRILANAKNVADKLMMSTKISISKAKEKTVIDAKLHLDQVLNDANRKVVSEFENMNKQIVKMSADISGKIISRVLSDLFTEEEKQKLILRALERIDEKITN